MNFFFYIFSDPFTLLSHCTIRFLAFLDVDCNIAAVGMSGYCKYNKHIPSQDSGVVSVCIRFHGS